MCIGCQSLYFYSSGDIPLEFDNILQGDALTQTNHKTIVYKNKGF